MRTKKIGKVKMTYTDDAEGYSDGKYEDMLLDFFSKNSPTDQEISQYIEENYEWPIIYHLSPLRRSLLDWIDFGNQSSLLEVGAGCGAVTGVFAQSCKSVTALELTRKRAEILAHRHKDKDNISVYVGNLQNFNPKIKFDFATSIGVLEYSGTFIESDDPYIDFIGQVKKHLKPGGTFILAIENKLGLKYWAGAREDHTWRFFDSIEGYPLSNNKRTFSKAELTTLLEKAGFSSIDFYYPIPDMKLPIEIYSDRHLPGNSTVINPMVIPSPALDAPRINVFNEWLALNSIIDSGEFPMFSNSFLVLAR